MESLEILLKAMRPQNLCFKKRDHKIVSMLNDGLPDEILVINKESLQYYSATIDEEAQEMLAQFVNMLTTNSSPATNYNIVYSRINSFYADFKDFVSKVKSDEWRILTFFESFESFVNEYPIQKTGEFLFSELTESRQQSINEYLDVTLKQVEKVIQEVNDYRPSNPDSEVPKKIKYNLSVGEIALLFRLLLENKTIEVPVKEELFRQISTNCESSRAESISINSLRKKFHDPDSTTLNDIDVLLVNLRQILKSIR